MVIQHNLLAMNANRQTGIVNKKKAKSTEKLSSGYKVNRAADDAAGLAISEKMRRQIRGLTQASANCQDGISFCQIADGAMSEVADMLHRMEVLSVQAANETLSDDDRAYLQNEIVLLKEEIDDIDQHTVFNETPVFAWDRNVEIYDVSAGGGVTLTETVQEVVTGTDYGLKLVVGSNHIYDGTKLDDPLVFSGTGWHSTGEVKYGYSIHSSGALSINSVADNIRYYYKNYNNNSSLDNTAILAQLNTAHTWTDFDAATGKYLKITTTSNGTRDLNGNSLVDSIKYEYGTYDPLVGSGSAQREGGSTYYIGDGGEKATGLNNGKTYGCSWIDFSGLGTDYQLSDLIGEGFNTTCATCTEHYSIYFTDSGPNYQYYPGSAGPRVEINISGCSTGSDIVNAIMAAVNGSNLFGNHYTSYAYNDSDPGKLYMYDSRSRYNHGGSYSKFEPSARSEQGTLIIKNTTIHDPGTGNLQKRYMDGVGLWIQAGADAYQGFYLKRARVGTDFLGCDSVDVSTAEDASRSMELVKGSLHILNSQRTMVGAQQNRMEHTVKNLDNVVENTTAAESRIRDTDMAKEMVEFANSNILEQAGMTMLAQANQMNQNIISLLS